MVARILIVDDNPHICSMLERKLNPMGYEVKAVHTLEVGLLITEKESWDVIILDIYMPDGNGLEYISRFVKSPNHPEVIIVTGDGSRDGAEKAIHGGAWTYIEKTNVISDLPLHLTRALQYREEKKRADSLPLVLNRKNMIGESEAMHRCYEDLARAAGSDVRVLLTGQTGTGKEIFARTIHDNSSRSTGAFVVVDCASLPESLMESTLFGHVKGAFTGADGYRGGLIRHADGGTLFLDEIGELPLDMQKILLRVLQEQKFRPLGSEEEVQSNFRLLAATNCNLDEMVSQGLFREDLLYRIKGLSIHLPPLNERKEDIRDLVVFCMTRLCERTGQEMKGLACDFLDALLLHDWPGNVRELFQTIEQAFAKAINTPTLFCIYLPEIFRIRMAHAGVEIREKNRVELKASLSSRDIRPWREEKAEMEEAYIARLLEECGGDIQKACDRSGLSRARLYQLINKYISVNNHTERDAGCKNFDI